MTRNRKLVAALVALLFVLSISLVYAQRTHRTYRRASSKVTRKAPQTCCPICQMCAKHKQMWTRGMEGGAACGNMMGRGMMSGEKMSEDMTGRGMMGGGRMGQGMTEHGPMGNGMMGRGPMEEGMMGGRMLPTPPVVVVDEGSVYVLRGNELFRFSKDLKLMSQAEIPPPERRMQKMDGARPEENEDSSSRTRGSSPRQ